MPVVDVRRPRLGHGRNLPPVTTTPDWHTDEYPELRDGPPWVTEEMTAAQPDLPKALLGAPSDAVRALATAVREARTAGQPVSVVGCGTSEHGAMAFAALLDEALGGGWPPAASSRQSLDAAERPQRGGVCIGISHDGGTKATALALQAARENGATTAMVTNRPRGQAEIVLETPLHDDSWCHTVAYTSTILAGAAVARELGLQGVDAGAAEALMRAALERDAPSPAGARRVLCTGAGIDLITARELALKIAEGARLPTAALHLETMLHGNLAGEDAGTALVLVDTDGGGRVGRRGALAEAAVAEIGMPTARIGPPPAHGGLNESLARLLGGAIALHVLTLALVRARDVNPDLIRRDEESYRRAGAAADGDW
jgi:glutamine---fructose-6-phosphate transaminase (isomerizing)